MLLGIAEDFTTDVSLDGELKSVPVSGMYANSGVHPAITIGNLLSFLPWPDHGFEQWSGTTAYGVFSKTRSGKDIVSKNNKIYQSIKEGTGMDPETETAHWLPTNIESILLKDFLYKVNDKVLADLELTKRIVNNQYLYENGKTARTLSGDYSAIVIEPKGSDYVSFRINEISVQKEGTTALDVYVINQGQIIETISVTPDNGALNFQAINLELSGKGPFYLAIDSTEVLTGGGILDPLKYDGFVVYTATGTGDAPETAKYSISTIGNGIGINLTAYLDASKYIENNLSEFGNFVRAVFEVMAFQTFLYNPNNRSNRGETVRMMAGTLKMSDNMLVAELKNLQADTAISRYYREKKKAMKALEKTFDTQLADSDELEITVGSI